MRFYSWKSWEGVGDLIAEPRWLAWDPDASMAALAYSDAVVLCRAQPTFSAVASLSIQVIRASPAHARQILWHRKVARSFTWPDLET